MGRCLAADPLPKRIFFGIAGFVSGVLSGDDFSLGDGDPFSSGLTMWGEDVLIASKQRLSPNSSE